MIKLTLLGSESAWNSASSANGPSTVDAGTVDSRKWLSPLLFETVIFTGFCEFRRVQALLLEFLRHSSLYWCTSVLDITLGHTNGPVPSDAAPGRARHLLHFAVDLPQNVVVWAYMLGNFG